MRPIIKKVAVLGAGVMGAQIAAHLANSNVAVVLFDLASKDKNKSSAVRAAIKSLAKLKPPPFATSGLDQKISAANYDEDLALLGECDLIIEAIAEKMEWKKSLYEMIAPYVQSHAILASNTSGLSITELSKQLPKLMRQQFIGVHFFNPPRYMQLVELIPVIDTAPEVIKTLEPFLVSTLGKGVVIAKDTPNFIGNRIGVFSLLATMVHAQRLKIPFEVVDQITGAPLGRPKSGTFRTADVVGLDIMSHVIDTLKQQLKGDPWQAYYETPDYVLSMIEQGALGQKVGKGIYLNKGKQVYSPIAGGYVDADQHFDKDVAQILREENWAIKIEKLRASDHPHAQFILACLRDLFHYCLLTLDEIAQCARDVDFAIRWGFGWSQGPFEIMQQIGFSKSVAMLKDALTAGDLLANTPLPNWVNEIENIHTPKGSFSASENRYVPLSNHPVYQRQILRENVLGSINSKPLGSTIFENDSARLWHEHDGIAVLSLKTKLHTINSQVLQSFLDACTEAEANYDALVVWHVDAPFGAGADLKEASQHHANGQFDKVIEMVENFQHVSMALKHCYVPTVAAVQGLALGGACEFQMHCNLTIATQESYVGLVEAGVGLLPAGGGLKEFALRSAQTAKAGTPKAVDLMPGIQAAFEATAMAKVATSGRDAMTLGLMTNQDIVIANPHELLTVAKAQAMAMVQSGFRPPSREDKVVVMGKTGKANLMMIAINMLEGNFISEHDYEIAERIASTLTGGDVEAGSMVSQEWLLKLERENFYALLKNEKTQARIAHTMTTGKPLRN